MITADHIRLPREIALSLCAKSPEALAALCRVLWFARVSGECFASLATLRATGVHVALPVLRRGLVALQDRGLLLALANPERSCVTYRPTPALAKSPKSVFIPPEVWRGCKPSALAAWVVWRLLGCDAGELGAHVGGRAGKTLSRSQGYAIFRTMKAAGLCPDLVRKTTPTQSGKCTTNTEYLIPKKEDIYTMYLSNSKTEPRHGNMGDGSDAHGADAGGRPREILRQARGVHGDANAGPIAKSGAEPMDTGQDAESIAASYQAGSCSPSPYSPQGLQPMPALRGLPLAAPLSQLSLPIRAQVRVVRPEMTDPLAVGWIDWMEVSEHTPCASVPMPAAKVPTLSASIPFEGLAKAWRELVAACPVLAPAKVLLSPTGLPPAEERALGSQWQDCAADYELCAIPNLAEFINAGGLDWRRDPKYRNFRADKYVATKLATVLMDAENWRKGGRKPLGKVSLQPAVQEGDILQQLTKLQARTG